MHTSSGYKMKSIIGVGQCKVIETNDTIQLVTNPPLKNCKNTVGSLLHNNKIKSLQVDTPLHMTCTDDYVKLSIDIIQSDGAKMLKTTDEGLACKTLHVQGGLTMEENEDTITLSCPRLRLASQQTDHIPLLNHRKELKSIKCGSGIKVNDSADHIEIVSEPISSWAVKGTKLFDNRFKKINLHLRIAKTS